jgi:hypothetical protein
MGLRKKAALPSRLIPDRRADKDSRPCRLFARSPSGSNEIAVTHDDLAREGARRMIAVALEAEVDEYLDSFVDEVGGLGRRLAVRNGHARATRHARLGTARIRAPAHKRQARR